MKKNHSLTLSSILQKKLFHTPITSKEFLLVTLFFIILLLWFFGKSFPTHYLAGDWLAFWMPNYYFTLSSLKEGIIPLWQPYSYMGVPAAFHPGYMIFYPPLWIVFLINLLINPHLSFNLFGKLFELYLYFHCLVGGWSFYFLLRDKVKLSAPASFAGSFIFIFSIFSLTSMDPTLIGKMYLPLLIYLLINFIEKRTFLTFILWICCNCIIWTFGYPYYQIYFFYAQLTLGVIYGLRSGLSVVIGLGIATILSAYILLPQAYYYMQANRIGDAAQANFHTMFSPQTTFLADTLVTNGIYAPSTLSWGTIPLIFLFTGFAALKKNRFTIWMILTFAVTLILGMGGNIGMQNLLGIPPFFLDKLRSHGQIFVLTFFVGTIIIASGIDFSLQGKKNSKIEMFLWFFCLLLLVFLLLIPFFKEAFFSEINERVLSLGRVVTLFISGLLLYYFLVKFKNVLFLVLILFLTFFEFNYHITKIEHHNLGATYNEYFARNSLIPEIPTKDNLFRYEFWLDQFMYNTSYLKVFSLSGYDGIPYAAFYNINRFSTLERYQFANVKYLVTAKEENIPQLTLVKKILPNEHNSETIYSNQEGFTGLTKTSQNIHYIYKINNYLPRFYAPNEVRTCSNTNCYTNENPPKLIYTKEANIAMKNPLQDQIKITVDKYEPNTIDLHINTSKKTFIASSEIWDKGWKMTINNTDSSIFNVSNGFRGFIVPAGKSTVVMSYSPPFFSQGLMISFVGIVSLIIICMNRKIKSFVLKNKSK